LFCSFEPKYKHPGLGSKAKEHRACILQRITKDDGEEDFDPEFSMQYPQPFTQHWYNGEEGEKRLHAARDGKKRTQTQGAGGGSEAAGADGSGAERPRRIIQEDGPGGDSEDRTPNQRSKAWDMVRVIEEGKGPRVVRGTSTVERYRKIQCILGDGRVCKNKWSITLWSGSTGAIHKHIKSVSDAHHQNALKILRSESSNQVQTEDGEFVQVLGFDELFDHHCRATSCLIHTCMSENTLRNEKFLEYVQGFELRAKPPSQQTVKRLSKIMLELIEEGQDKVIQNLRKEYKETECLGLQLDGWSSENDVSFYVANLTRIDVVDGEVVLVDEVLDFSIFPFASHTAANIKKWFLDLLEKRGILLSMITVVTADGAANGQAAINSIPELQDKVCIYFYCVV
jgi:hypothetical protein